MSSRGVLLPLFAATTSRSWGIGDCADIDALTEWMAEAGFTELMLLPLGTMADGQSSPYSACSAMAIDPIYIAIDRVDDFHRAGGLDALARVDPDAVAALATARSSPRVNYAAVRRAKSAALELAFNARVPEMLATLAMPDGPDVPPLKGRPTSSDPGPRTPDPGLWTHDYALYRSLSRRLGPDWRAWPAPLAQRDPHALAQAADDCARDIAREQYLQRIVNAQWQDARAAANARGVRIYGDMPFAVETNSADVWTRAHEFDLALSAGVPPDAFSDTGQDWGLPVYRWDVVAAGGFQWLRERAARAAQLFDGVRVDHLVGFFRTYARAHDGRAWFTPGDQGTQQWQGEQVLRVIRDAGIDVLAEDLGVIPDFVRDTLTRLHVPGYKVFRWERAYDQPGQPFIDPACYPEASVAATGTHDTETMAVWWTTLSDDERASALGTPDSGLRTPDPALRTPDPGLRTPDPGLRTPDPGLRTPAPGLRTPDSGPRTRDVLLTRVLRAVSRHAFIPIQDVFGWSDRINTPATVGDHNWTWRLPWPVDRWRDQPDAVERAAFCRRTIRGE